MAMAAHKFKTLDVRPILAKGVEPLSKIRESIDALGTFRDCAVSPVAAD